MILSAHKVDKIVFFCYTVQARMNVFVPPATQQVLKSVCLKGNKVLIAYQLEKRMKKIALVVRGFTPTADQVEPSKVKFADYLQASFACTAIDRVYFAVDPKRDVGDTANFLSALPVPTGKSLIVTPVIPWGRYVPPLNTLFGQAATDGYEAVLSVNLEHRPTDVNISQLMHHLDQDTLAVGAWLPVFHEVLPPGEYEMTGTTTPSDAFMLVDVQKFALFGFLGVSEAPWVPCPAETLGTFNDIAMRTAAGIKEVVAFAFIQKQLGYDQTKVKIVLGVTGANRDTSTLTEDRQEFHNIKRRTAIERAAEQLRRVNLPPGRTIYVA